MTSKPKHHIADVVRAMFPRPLANDQCDPEEEGNYCVGGAATMYYYMGLDSDFRPLDADGNVRFPTTSELSVTLSSMNPALPDHRAHHLADAIIRANDHGNFDHAWDILDKALAYQPTGERVPL